MDFSIRNHESGINSISPHCQSSKQLRRGETFSSVLDLFMPLNSLFSLERRQQT
jgi:hypothetical protein